mmetsp:Transcript_72210/g.145286  ORF Transcript_72210/g.145286 Transcript_72210/m.145286 type:complete len:248 (-) Transcript_72210:214-957(-)
MPVTQKVNTLNKRSRIEESGSTSHSNNSNVMNANGELSHSTVVVHLAAEPGVAIVGGKAPSDLAKASVDNGGCFLYAINKCVGWQAVEASDLNAVISTVHQIYNEMPEWAPDKFKREWVGTEDESWCIECLRHALLLKFGVGNFEFSKITGVTSVAGLLSAGQGTLLVWGKKNNTLWPDLPQGGNWQHAICVDTGSTPSASQMKFYELDHPKGRSVQKWLLHENKKERWMSQISRVYKLSVPKPSPR